MEWPGVKTISFGILLSTLITGSKTQRLCLRMSCYKEPKVLPVELDKSLNYVINASEDSMVHGARLFANPSARLSGEIADTAFGISLFDHVPDAEDMLDEDRPQVRVTLIYNTSRELSALNDPVFLRQGKHFIHFENHYNSRLFKIMEFLVVMPRDSCRQECLDENSRPIYDPSSSADCSENQDIVDLVYSPCLGRNFSIKPVTLVEPMSSIPDPLDILTTMVTSARPTITTVTSQLTTLPTSTVFNHDKNGSTTVPNVSEPENHSNVDEATFERRYSPECGPKTLLETDYVVPDDCCPYQTTPMGDLRSVSVRNYVDFPCRSYILQVECLPGPTGKAAWDRIDFYYCQNNQSFTEIINDDMVSLERRLSVAKTILLLNREEVLSDPRGVYNLTRRAMEERMSLPIESAHLVFSLIDTLLSFHDERESVKKKISLFSGLFSKLAAKVKLESPDQRLLLQSRSMLMLVTRLSPSSSKKFSYYLNDSVIITADNDSGNQSFEASSEVIVYLPDRLSSALSPTRIKVIYHQVPPPLMESKMWKNKSLVSSIISIDAITNGDIQKDVQVDVMFSVDRNDTSQALCVYWDVEEALWSNSGCHFMGIRNRKWVCRCNHTTSFALLFGPSDPAIEAGDRTLGYVSIVGCAISLVSLTIFLLYACLNRKLYRSSSTQMVLCLSIALLGLYVFFILGVFAVGGTVSKYCRTAAALLHFFMLSSIFWMGIQATSLVLNAVLIWKVLPSKMMRKCSLVAWGVPTLVVAICAGVNIQDYGVSAGCVVSGNSFYFGLMLPSVLILTFNVVVLVLVFRTVRQSRARLAEDASFCVKDARLLLGMTALLGLSWLFGGLAISKAKVVMQYLFTITTSLQGFFILLCQVLMRKKNKTTSSSSTFDLQKRSNKTTNIVTSEGFQ